MREIRKLDINKVFETISESSSPQVNIDYNKIIHYICTNTELYFKTYMKGSIKSFAENNLSIFLPQIIFRRSIFCANFSVN